jgi:hypothetical protein
MPKTRTVPLTVLNEHMMLACDVIGGLAECIDRFEAYLGVPLASENFISALLVRQ